MHDAAVMLAKTGPNRFYGELEAPPSGRYYANLQPSIAAGEAAEPWRLQREIRLPSHDPMPFGGDP
jgi:hypothetical protein